MKLWPLYRLSVVGLAQGERPITEPANLLYTGTSTAHANDRAPRTS
jgi:hypothetical protein